MSECVSGPCIFFVMSLLFCSSLFGLILKHITTSGLVFPVNWLPDLTYAVSSSLMLPKVMKAFQKD